MILEEIRMKTVAIIGAGASGLAAVKCCLDEGLEPVCYEMSTYIGGLWHYTETVKERQACVIKTTVANVSKEMMCYSDYPPPKECPIYMHYTDALKYLEDYAQHFKLTEHIKFNTEVLRVERSVNFTETGRWKVTTKDLSINVTKSQEFDGVLICTGGFANPHVPVFPGQNRFMGKILHSHQYRRHEEFEGKRVLIVGIGNTAGDIAVDLSFVASKVFISSKQGAWIMSRLAKKGKPNCMDALSRITTYIMNTTPSLANKLMYKIVNSKFDHDKFSMRPTFPPLKTNGLVNDDLPSRIISGRVEMHANVKTLTETGVEFVDGLSQDDIDVVILATGYRVDFPFLEEGVIGEDKRDLYKAIFPPDLAQNTLGVIGGFRLRGPVVPAVEMQSRCATRVFKGHIKLPSRDEMWADIRRRKEHQKTWFNESLHYSLQVDYIPYLDELGRLIGCKPSFAKLLLSDPQLAFKVFFGPCTPYQHRLTGPGAWSGARQAIMTQWERTYYPVNTRRIDNQYVMKSSRRFYAYFVACVAVVCYFWFR